MAKKGKQQLSEQEKGSDWKVDQRSKINFILTNSNQEQIQDLLGSFAKIDSASQDRICLSLFCGGADLELPANVKQYKEETTSNAVKVIQAEKEADEGMSRHRNIFI